MSTVCAVILAGGQSRRMGTDKAALRCREQTFLQRIATQLCGFEERLLSVDRAGRFPAHGFAEVEDLVPGRGPMGGLYAALRACAAPYLLAVSCDMPLFTAALGEYLCAFVSEQYDVFAAVTRMGKVQPLCAVYSKRAAETLHLCLEEGDYRIMNALARLRVKYVPLCHSVYPDDAVRNINTPADYAALARHMQGPVIAAISGVKNSGKTTLLCGILPILRRHGLRVAVIKHDGHDFAPDVPGTDSDRIRAAGAYGVAVYSPRRYLITEACEGIAFETLSARFPDADLILAEGLKHSALPKIEVVRAARSSAPVGERGTLLAVCTDLPLDLCGVPTLALGDYEGAAAILLNYVNRTRGISNEAN